MLDQITQKTKPTQNKQGASGTIDQIEFVKYFRRCIYPLLGNFLLGQENSIVILDNASVHFHPEIQKMCDEKKAYLLFLSPYSPDFNPIEKMFHIYKSALRRLAGRSMTDKEKHIDALLAVTSDMTINEFRHYSVPMGKFISNKSKREIAELLIVSYAIKKLKR